MFKKKHYIKIIITDDNLDIDHNIDEKISLDQLKLFLIGLNNGNFSAHLLKRLAKDVPNLRDFLAQMYLILYPIPEILNDPIIKPSEVINRFISQLKGLVNE